MQCAHIYLYLLIYHIVLFGQYLSVHCYCAHTCISGFGLTSQRAAQCYGILISILVFPIKPHYINKCQKSEILVYSILDDVLNILFMWFLMEIPIQKFKSNSTRICVFVFSIFPAFPLIYRECLCVCYEYNVLVHVQYFAPTVRV